MWIMTQNMKRMINTDQVVDIFVAKTAPIIYAETIKGSEHIVLGEYSSIEECTSIVTTILAIFTMDHPSTVMPTKGNVETWNDIYAKTMKKVYSK